MWTWNLAAQIWDWDFAIRILPQLARAFVLTVQITLVSGAIAMIGGLLLMLARRSRLRVARLITGATVEFIRSTPLLVQLYFVFFVLPEFGLRLSPLMTGILTLSLHYSAYTSEVYRGGIESVPQGQWDAALVLDLPRTTTWRVVILPQMIPLVMAPLSNYFILMFKDTPILSAITVFEVLTEARVIGARTFRYTEPMTIIGLLFLMVSYISSVALRAVERRVAYRR